MDFPVASNNDFVSHAVLPVDPEVILMDEPTSALDPVSTHKVEELISYIKNDVTIAIVTHNMQQASRISDRTAFFLNGEIIECDQHIYNLQQSDRPIDKRLYQRSFWLRLMRTWLSTRIRVLTIVALSVNTNVLYLWNIHFYHILQKLYIFIILA